MYQTILKIHEKIFVVLCLSPQELFIETTKLRTPLALTIALNTRHQAEKRIQFVIFTLSKATCSKHEQTLVILCDLENFIKLA